MKNRNIIDTVTLCVMGFVILLSLSSAIFNNEAIYKFVACVSLIVVFGYSTYILVLLLIDIYGGSSK